MHYLMIIEVVRSEPGIAKSQKLVVGFGVVERLASLPDDLLQLPGLSRVGIAISVLQNANIFMSTSCAINTGL